MRRIHPGNSCASLYGSAGIMLETSTPEQLPRTSSANSRWWAASSRRRGYSRSSFSRQAVAEIIPRRILTGDASLDGLAGEGVRFRKIRNRNMMDTTPELEASSIELRERGQVTLPKSLRDALHLETGDALRAVKIANAIVLTPKRLDLDALRNQMRKLMKQHGVSAEDLLRDL